MVNVDGHSIASAAVAFGVDEKRFLNASPTRRTVFTTQIVDLDSHQILDAIEGAIR